jgi:soluble lytic murein transglycosylase-like protein
VLALSLLLSLASAPVADVASVRLPDRCNRRADIIAVRAADDVGLVALRRSFDDEVAAAKAPVAKACAAAVAAEGAIRAGDKGGTLRLLETMVAGLPELADDVRPHRIVLLAELGRVDEARAELARLSPKSSWHERLIALTSSAPEALPALRRRASRDPVAMSALCEQGEAASCRQLVVRFPGHPAARAIEDRVASTLSLAERAARVQALVGAARPQRAAAEGLAALALPSTGADNIARREALLETLANALWRAERTAEALPLTSSFRRPDGHVAGPVARGQARTFARLGRFAEAGAVWAAIRDDDGVAPAERAEAAFFAGFSAVEVDDVDGAVAAFDAGGAVLDGTPWQEQADWYRALLLLTIKHDALAAESLLSSLSTTTTEPRKYRYWRAQALSALGRPAEAKQALQALIKEAPLDWYGLLARRSLGLAPLKGAVVAADAIAGPADDDGRMTRLLYALGFDDEASAHCRRRAAGKRAPSLAEVGLCQEVGDPTFGWRHGAFFTPRPEVKGGALSSSPTWRVSFARPWRTIVDGAASSSGATASFVMAIMRTESGFDPGAVSAAGAKGLLQLLPSVARGTAVATSLPPTLPARLSDVDANILLGAHLLGLLQREHGSMLLAAAAYNAGPEPAVGWATRFGSLPPELLVERISFKETRNYVKKVLAAEAVYRGLDGGEVSLALPEHIVPAKTFTRFPYDE